MDPYDLMGFIWDLLMKNCDLRGFLWDLPMENGDSMGFNGIYPSHQSKSNLVR